RSTQLLPTAQLLLYQLLIMPHLRRRLSRLRLPAMWTPPSSPLSPWSSPLPQIPFPPLPPIPSPSLPLSPPLPVSGPPPTSPIRPLGYQASMIRLRAKAASTSHSLLLPPLSVRIEWVE
ncbi:hypothetical protein Tco_1454359, partial [Tanacetum coccineum]